MTYQVVKMLRDQSAGEVLNVTVGLSSSLKYGECLDNIIYCEFLRNNCTLQLGR